MKLRTTVLVPHFLRVTHVYRRENGEWKIVHCHGAAPAGRSEPFFTRPGRSDAGVTGSSKPNDQGAEPETDQERAFLAAYRAMDEADRVLLWSEMLAELGWRPSPEPEAGPHEGKALRS